MLSKPPKAPASVSHLSIVGFSLWEVESRLKGIEQRKVNEQMEEVSSPVTCKCSLGKEVGYGKRVGFKFFFLYITSKEKEL